MPLFEHKNIGWVTAGFFFIFAGFGTALRLIVPLFALYGMEQEATFSLLAIYVSFFIANLSVQKSLNGLGLKKALFVGGIPYVAFSALSMFGNPWTLYAASILVGVGAALLWNASGQIINLSSSKATVGKNSGLKLTGLQLGVFVAVLCVTPFLNSHTNYVPIFGVLTIVTGLGLCCFYFIENPTNKLQCKPPTLRVFFELRFFVFFPLIVSAYLLGSLASSSINLIVLDRFGIEYVGVVTTGAAIGGLVTGTFTGWISDRFGGVTAALIVFIFLILGGTTIAVSSNPWLSAVAASFLFLAASGTYAPFFRLIRDYIPESEHDLAINAYGLYSNAGSIFGFGAALLFSPLLALLVGIAVAIIALPSIVIIKRKKKLIEIEQTIGNATQR